MELRIAHIQSQIVQKSLEYDLLFSSSQVVSEWERKLYQARMNKTLNEIESLRKEVSELVVRVVFGVDRDGKRDIFRYEGEEKPWIDVYEIIEISKDKFEWILEHPNAREAVDRYFPNI